MSLIIPANTLASGGFAVDNSCRFNRASSDYLTRSTGTPDSRRIATFSVWVKRGDLSSSDNMDLFCITTDTTHRVHIRFQGDDIDIINYDETTNARLTTDRKFRDISAWYHIVVVLDSTQATDSNRMKLYINGVQETSFSTATYPTLNFDFDLNFTNTQIGKSDVGTAYFGGYMSEVLYLDGTAAAITDLGEFNEDSGIWKPIDVSGLTFGTNGFYLDFEDSAALGDDVSGNGNDFTVNNLTAIDQTTDTPTNNFCTLNPLVYSTGLTFSEGNCKLVTAGSSTSGGIGTIGMPSGKWYYEVKLGSDIDNHTHGIISEFTNTNQSALQNKVGVTSWINGDGGEVVVDGSATTADYGLYTINQIMGIAVDVDNSTISYYRDGSALVTGFTISTTRGTLFPLIKMGINTTAEVNFGNPTFTISSSNTDANGYGNFEYSPTIGGVDYLALCTKNLSEVLG
jgi:hypothetical protein